METRLLSWQLLGMTSVSGNWRGTESRKGGLHPQHGPWSLRTGLGAWGGGQQGQREKAWSDGTGGWALVAGEENKKGVNELEQNPIKLGYVAQNLSYKLWPWNCA